jgi:hypothetical protein
LEAPIIQVDQPANTAEPRPVAPVVDGYPRRPSVLDLSTPPCTPLSESTPHLLGKATPLVCSVAIPGAPASRGLLELFSDPDLAPYLRDRLPRATGNQRARGAASLPLPPTDPPQQRSTATTTALS